MAQAQNNGTFPENCLCSPIALSICKILQLRLWRRPDGPGAGAVAERVRLPGVPPRHALHLPQHVQVDAGDTQFSSAVD